jgi:hypothetical protein
MCKLVRWPLVTAAWLAAASSALATDPWEIGLDGASGTTCNILRHGDVQSGHDLQGAVAAPDRDWMVMVTKARHSYEVRVGSLFWRDACAPPDCTVRVDRVNAAGLALTEGAIGNEDPGVPGVGSIGRTVRWIATTGATDYLLAFALTGLGASPYDVALYDTTLFVPRWNNTATQTTVLFLQNTTNVAVTGSVYFHDGGGGLLATVPVDVPQHGLQVIATASVPGLSGQSGSAQIAQLGGYGALVGKAVALEPGTGFTFDTAITPLAR